MQRSKIVNPASQEVGETFKRCSSLVKTAGAEVIAGDEDLRHDTEAFAHEDGGAR